MNESPRFHQNQCKPLQTGAEGQTAPTTAVGEQSQETQAVTTGADDFHNISTTSGPDFHNTPAEIEAWLDRRMVRVLLELSTTSQVKAVSPETRGADANALRLPVNAQGKGLTDDPVASLATDYKRAGRIPDQGKRHRLKLQLVRDASRELSGLRYSRKATPDLGTQDGRLHIARHAEKHGTRRAAEAYCSDPDDPKSVERMMRNIRNYRAELQKVNKRK